MSLADTNKILTVGLIPILTNCMLFPIGFQEAVFPVLQDHLQYQEPPFFPSFGTVATKSGLQ